jgi:hypothetical protein
MHDHMTRVALVRNMDCATAAMDNTRATPLSHHWHDAMECMRTCKAQTRTIEPNQ